MDKDLLGTDTTPMERELVAIYEALKRLLGREVTHLYAVPLRGQRQTIEGMISLEAECPTAVGQDFVFVSWVLPILGLAWMASDAGRRRFGASAVSEPEGLKALQARPVVGSPREFVVTPTLLLGSPS